MKHRRWVQWVDSRQVLAVFAGLMWSAAFPTVNLASVAWLVPALLLLAVAGTGGGRVFRLGFLAGFTHDLSSLYWLLHIPFPGGPIVGWFCLSAFLALYPGLWVWLAWQCLPGHVLLPKTQSVQEPWLVLALSWRQRQTWALACAVLWVALEMVRARFLTGFPWNLLGASQYQMLPLIQITAITGLYGLSFLMVWFSVSLLGAVATLVLKPSGRMGWLGDIILPLMALMAVLLFGVHQVSRPAEAGRTLKVALVQPSIPQTLIWDPSENTNRFRKLMQLSRLALAAQPDLLVWPEGAVPNDADLTFPATTNLVRSAKVWLVLCADDATPRLPARKTNDYDMFNASFLLSPAGEVRAVYHKQKLVMFGEYVPLVRWFPFLRWFTPTQEGFSAGDRPVPFSMPTLRARTSVLICFEDVFPELARAAVQPTTDFLVNLTNDGWFGHSAAQWQHAANALFRAVENGLPLVRCTNNGLTCWIDPFGRMHVVYLGQPKDIYGAGFEIVQIPLPPFGHSHQTTLYNRYGDWFGWTCVALAGILFLAPLRRHTTFGRSRGQGQGCGDPATTSH